MDAAATAEFEAQRRHLSGIAYRMLGSHAEAEDAVQETWLRWNGINAEEVESPRAWLTRTLTRLCLDRLKSAQAQREVYVGPWLPEPLVETAGLHADDAGAATELASDLSYAFLLALERLSPAERAAFLLHDVFDMDYSGIASALERSEASCRQLAARARERVRQERPRFTATTEQRMRLTQMFLLTARTGNVEALSRMLAEDAVLMSDGGGRTPSARIPVRGAQRIAKAMAGFATKHAPPADAKVLATQINGLPGVMISDADGEPIQTMALEFNSDDRISGVYIVRNPDKLRHLRRRRG